MAESSLDHFGGSRQPQAPRATNGGVMEVKPIPYSPPVGPQGINDRQSPGLHGTNHGNDPSCNK